MAYTAFKMTDDVGEARIGSGRQGHCELNPPEDAQRHILQP